MPTLADQHPMLDEYLRTRDVTLRDQLCEAYLPFVRMVVKERAKRWRLRHADREDMMGDVLAVLPQIVEQYEHRSKGPRFATFVSMHVKWRCNVVARHSQAGKRAILNEAADVDALHDVLTSSKTSNPHRTVELRELCKIVFRNLPLSDKAMLWLVAVERFSFQEIGEFVGISKESAREWYSEIVNNLLFGLGLRQSFKHIT